MRFAIYRGEFTAKAEAYPLLTPEAMGELVVCRPATRCELVLKSLRFVRAQKYKPTPSLPISIYQFGPRMLSAAQKQTILATLKKPKLLTGFIMDASFWHQRWEKNEIAFHKSKANPLLVKHFNELSLGKGSRIFLPLCGKTLDISWLLSNGYRVAGAELSQIAIEQLFMNLGVQPKISGVGEVEQWSANNLDIFVGDIFALSRKILGPVDAVYDRAALVAFPEQMRNRYSSHLTEITEKAPQLLICYDYDQRLMEGPPFSISNEEVHRHYTANYEVTLIASTDVSGGLKGKCASKENVWLLKK